MQNAITYELSLTQIGYERMVYNFLDVLRDVGGLYSSLGPLCILLVRMLQYRGSYLFIAATMLKEKDE